MKTQFLYHLVPRRVVGHEIVPLNILQARDERLHAAYARKYIGREDVPKQKIPPLDCLWNDVVFMTAVHPLDLLAAYTRAGATLHKRKFYQIDPHQLDPARATVWLYRTDDKSPENFVPFDPATLADHSHIPDKTVEHYRVQLTRKQPFFMFAYVPHILFKGPIDISKAPIIGV